LLLCPSRWFYIVVVPIDRVGGNMLAPRWNTPEELELDEVREGASID
jgi:netrin-G3 ligand